MPSLLQHLSCFQLSVHKCIAPLPHVCVLLQTFNGPVPAGVSQNMNTASQVQLCAQKMQQYMSQIQKLQTMLSQGKHLATLWYGILLHDTKACVSCHIRITIISCPLDSYRKPMHGAGTTHEAPAFLGACNRSWDAMYPRPSIKSRLTVYTFLFLLYASALMYHPVSAILHVASCR